MTRQRVRIRFGKQGDLRLISHRDLMRTWERLLRRAGIELAMTEGFHPKPKMMFPSALAVGIEGLDEVLELELLEEQDPSRLLELIRSQAPPGLQILNLTSLAATGRTRLRGMTFAVEVPAERRPETARRIAVLLEQDAHSITREGRAAPLDLRPLIEKLTLGDDGTLLMGLRIAPDGGARPREVLAAIGLPDVEELGIVLRRTAVEVANA